MANSYLTRTYGSAGNQRIFTISFWFKRSNLATGHFFTYQDAASQIRSDFSIVNDRIGINFNPTGSAWGADLTIQDNGTNILFRDTNAWYHIVMAFDTTQATASNRLKVYVNGEQKTMSGYPSQDFDTGYNTAIEHSVGTYIHSPGGNYFDGYISHFAVVDGQQLAPTVFGETDSTSGIWKFKSPSGLSWGTNGFHLKFENSGNLGLDSSGQTNNFTTNGNLKQALDTPSNVYATWNNLLYRLNGGVSYKATFSNGNNTQTGISTNLSSVVGSTLGVTQGKWYAEFKYILPNSNTNNRVGIFDLDDWDQSSWIFASGSSAYGYRTEDGLKEYNGTQTSYGNSCANGDIIGVAFDATNGAIWFSKNGVWQNNATISEIGAGTTTYAAFTSIPSGTWTLASTTIQDVSFQANFGNGFFGTTAITSAGSNGNGSLFEYDVPSGYYALNTKNINTYG